MITNSSIINNLSKENFYIKLYFNTKEGFEIAGIKRAYLDFSRTLHKKNETDYQRIEKRNATENYLLSQLKTIIIANISSQKEFDLLHKKITLNLVRFWKKLTIGKSQKWINMSLKYWLLFGEKRILNIEKNARFFHIPIDSYVQKGMFNEKNPRPWSKINEYEVYMNYQIRHREKKTGNYPLIDEFSFFNKYNN